MNYKILIICSLLLLSIHLHISAQTGFSTCGGNVSTDEHTISFSMGQVFYLSAFSTSNYYSQGLQHSNLVSLPNGIDNLTENNSLISIYPNPVVNELHLKLKNVEMTGMNVKLYNSLGKMVMQTSFKTSEQILKMDNYASGIYMLVLSDNQIIRGFYKFIKK
jgi:hypothetical protein